jgi:hypothetical protein
MEATRSQAENTSLALSRMRSYWLLLSAVSTQGSKSLCDRLVIGKQIKVIEGHSVASLPNAYS